MFIRKYCKYKDNAKEELCVFCVKNTNQKHVPTKYFTNDVARTSTKTYQKIWIF